MDSTEKKEALRKVSKARAELPAMRMLRMGTGPSGMLVWGTGMLRDDELAGVVPAGMRLSPSQQLELRFFSCIIL